MPDEIPRVGLGTWQATDPVALKKAIIYAIEECGVRHIDTAQAYGNEAVVGEALKEIFAKGHFKRSDIWVTTKLWSTEHRPERVEQACRNSLQRLGLSFVDLYLVHQPMSIVPQADGALFPKGPDGKLLLEHIDIIDTWGAMEGLVGKKLVRFIGVSNFSIEMLERLETSKKVKIQPYANQVECSIYHQQVALIDYCTKRNIWVTAWSPLCCAKTGPFGTTVFEDPVVQAIAKEVSRTPAQVAIKYLLQLSPIVQVLPKSVNPPRIKEDFDIGFELTLAQRKRLAARNQAWRMANALEFAGYDLFSQGI